MSGVVPGLADEAEGVAFVAGEVGEDPVEDFGQVERNVFGSLRVEGSG